MLIKKNSIDTDVKVVKVYKLLNDSDSAVVLFKENDTDLIFDLCEVRRTDNGVNLIIPEGQLLLDLPLSISSMITNDIKLLNSLGYKEENESEISKDTLNFISSKRMSFTEEQASRIINFDINDASKNSNDKKLSFDTIILITTIVIVILVVLYFTVIKNYIH